MLTLLYSVLSRKNVELEPNCHLSTMKLKTILDTLDDRISVLLLVGLIRRAALRIVLHVRLIRRAALRIVLHVRLIRRAALHSLHFWTIVGSDNRQNDTSNSIT